jgi:hypothetical protein
VGGVALAGKAHRQQLRLFASSRTRPQHRRAPGAVHLDGGSDLAHLAAEAGPWAAWRPLGPDAGGVSDLTVGRHADGRLVVVALARRPAGGQELWRLEQTAPSNGWSDWRSLGPPADFVPESLSPARSCALR